MESKLSDRGEKFGIIETWRPISKEWENFPPTENGMYRSQVLINMKDIYGNEFESMLFP